MPDEFLADVRLGDVDVGDPGDAGLGAGTVFWRGGCSGGCEDGFCGWVGGVEGFEGGAETSGCAEDEDVVAHFDGYLAHKKRDSRLEVQLFQKGNY